PGTSRKDRSARPRTRELPSFRLGGSAKVPSAVARTTNGHGNKCQKKCDASKAVSVWIPTEQHCNKAAGRAIRGFIVRSRCPLRNTHFIFITVMRVAEARCTLHWPGLRRFNHLC